MSPTTATTAITVTEHAEAATRAVRGINHATLRYPGGYEWPGDVDAFLGHLVELAHGLDQAVRQAACWLDRADQNGRVGHDIPGTDIDTEVSTACCLLDQASMTVLTLADRLNSARAITSHFTGLEP